MAQQSPYTNSFDWVGNRLNLVPDTSTLEYNAADQLTRWPSHHRYECFDTGSLRYQKDDSSVTEKTYAYTYANLLSSVQHNDKSGTPSSSMTWDADGNRVSFTSSTGGTDYFVYDPTAGIPAVVEQNRQTSHHYYIREPGGELIARMTGTEPVLRYYHFDALGSTRLLTDDDGNVTDEYVYDAWGKLTDHTEHTGSVTQPFMFVGQLGYYSHYQDENLFDEAGWQLLHLGVRFYDAELGRFTQVDPIQRSVPGDVVKTTYHYCSDLPVTRTDPLGMFEVDLSCMGHCPQVYSWLPVIQDRARRRACADAIEAVGCMGYLPDGLSITIFCSKPGEREGRCANASSIEIDCSKHSANPGTIIHEAIHACFFAQKQPWKPSMEGWKCDKCPRRWPAGWQMDPAWEKAAESVRHACGF